MAFSTQKDFFDVPFMNEVMNESQCKKACVKLKSYNSSTDDRSWSSDPAKQSKFLTDLVSCNLLPSDGDGVDVGDHSRDGASSNINRDPGRGGLASSGYGGAANESSASKSRLARDVGPDGGTNDSDASKSRPVRNVGPANRLTDTDSGVDFGNNMLARHGLTATDSILDFCNNNLGRINDILSEKKHIEKQLEVSNERLKTANEENDKFKAIMNQKFDRNHSKDFYNKIKKLASSEKIDKNEETELLRIHRKMEEMNKANEVLKADNSRLKRLLEKLSQRVSLDNISPEQEKSTDTVYLQSQVNSLRKEILIMHKMEEDYRKNPRADGNKNHFSDQDAENLNVILNERNELRKKCQTFKDLEKSVNELQKKAQTADQMSRYIGEMEEEMFQMQKYLRNTEEQMEKLKFNEEILKSQIEEMKEDLCRAQCKGQKAKCLQMEVTCLHNELLQRDIALNDCDCQYRQLMHKLQVFKNNDYHIKRSEAGHNICLME